MSPFDVGQRTRPFTPRRTGSAASRGLAFGRSPDLDVNRSHDKHVLALGTAVAW